MPEFVTILIHIISCNDCRANSEMEKQLNNYEYWNARNNGDRFIENSLTAIRNRISEIASHIHSYI